MSKKSLILRLLLAVLILSVVVVLVFRIFFVWPIRVPTSSMANTIIPGDHLIVHRSFGALKRGDIVVFQHTDSAEYYVARVIGLPGETIQVRGKTVSINGVALAEERVMVEPENLDGPLIETSIEGSGPYRVYYTERPSGDDSIPPDDDGEFGTTTPFKIPADNYFIMGDNRDNSNDSRFRGPVPRNLIWGKPSIIYSSIAVPGGEVRTERIFKKLQ